MQHYPSLSPGSELDGLHTNQLPGGGVCVRVCVCVRAYEACEHTVVHSC